MKRTMDIILAILAVFLLGFIIVMIWLYYKTGAIPDTLCTCVFAICGGECGIMGWIKTTKDRYLDRKEKLEDRKYEEMQVKGFISDDEPENDNNVND
ncbi:MAG: hypothetical protein SO130_10985 [Agathobacter sp.]|nr:hypothetical protein [Agathobacter sp.]